jgi:hypothetical protein
VRVIVTIVTSALVCFPSVAIAGFGQLNAPAVSYRTAGVALLQDSSGRFKQAKLVDAPLGKGDRVKYLIVATNESDQPQVAGVSIRIPDLTAYQPPDTDQFDKADILQYSTDGKTWHSGNAREARGRIVAIRWVLAAPLEPHMSASYSFVLRLTGPYSDRTGDFNAARDGTTTVQTLSIPVLSGIISALGVRAQPAKATAVPPLPGFEIPSSYVQTGEGLRLIGRGSNVLYRAAGVALVRRSDGSFAQAPMQHTSLKEGDNVRYTIFATNQGSSNANAGSTIEIPANTQFLGARGVRGDGVEVTNNGLTWTPASTTNLRDDEVRAVRWVRQAPLAPGQSAAFSLELRVAGPYSDPKGDLNVSSQKGSGSLRPLAEAALQSIAFSRVLLRRNEDTVQGIPLDQHIVGDILKPTLNTGFQKSDYAPVATAPPEHQNLSDRLKHDVHLDNLDMNFVGFVVGIVGLGITGLVLVFARSRERPDKLTEELLDERDARGANRAGPTTRR